jgi:hydrogenase-4 component B
MSTGQWLWLAGLGMLMALGAAWRWPWAWLAGLGLGSGGALIGAAGILAQGGTWEWRASPQIGGETIFLRLDAVSAVFLALLGVLGFLGGLYATGYWTEREHPRSARAGRGWWVVLLSSMGMVLLEGNGLHFLIAWEVFAISAYFLITVERRRREVRAAGWLYLGASHAGTLCLFAFFAALAARTGTWELRSWAGETRLAPLYWLALAGFGLKAGLFPLHVWLPSAHANAPSHVSAILSGVALKLGIYGLMRFSGWLPVPEAAKWTITLAGVASAVLGVAFALGQHDLKRLLAYHSVENIGIILMGLGFAMEAAERGNTVGGRLAMAGALLHVWNHGLFKALLFLGAGSVLHATGTRRMSRLGGLWRSMPWTTSLFVLGAVAISGLPPLNGFVSEWLVYLGLIDAASSRGAWGSAAVAAVAFLALTGALALACFAKVCGVVFLGNARTPAAARAHECVWVMRIPMLVLAAACVAIGLAPAVFWKPMANAVAAWQPAWATADVPASMGMLGAWHVALVFLGGIAVVALRGRVKRNGVQRGVTWDCGYAAPSPRMQYTAGSFAGIITSWFAWILQPHVKRHMPKGPFPAAAGYSEHTPETVLEQIVEPAGRMILIIAHGVRRLQHGRIQLYLVYLIAGLVGIAVAMFGGTP